ncbi:hypothetical protein DEO72_LG3g759 [Vigna unguiculata]|uniref:Uncharacterized protein n=1 Tax=Vigna unguiculata TaxID=3917 RepID=A0A4D6LCF7_VIGUN|nr:hypothetical protein DEO72_LG3g759 [Vigna unguiculata]
MSRLSETPQPGRDAGRGCAISWTFDVSRVIQEHDIEMRLGPRLIGVVMTSGETSGVALQWSRRNSMAPVRGCSWWCPICITRIEQLRFEQGYPHKCKHPLNPTKLYVSG